MELTPPNGRLSLGIVGDGKRLRMFITDGTKELACHKLSRKELDVFLQSETAHLFKGRLQLIKNKELMTIILRNEVTGIIEAKDLRCYIDSI